MLITEKGTERVLAINPAGVIENDAGYIFGNPAIMLLKANTNVYPNVENNTIDYTAKDWFYNESDGFYLKPEEPTHEENIEQAYRDKLVQEVNGNA